MSTREASRIGRSSGVPSWLAVGARVVMQPHGIGEVAGNEVLVDVDGRRRFVVVRFESGVRVHFPEDHASNHLRPVISPEAAEASLAGLHARSLVPSAAGSDAPSERRRSSHEGAALVLQRLYAEGAHLGAGEDARLVDELEGLVLREIALVLERPVEEVRRIARGA